jgi:GTPase
VALNKWDIRRVDLDDARSRLERRTRLRPPIIACSARTGRGVPELLRGAVTLADRRASRIPTPELNRFLADVVAATPPPARRGGRRLRLYYIAQVETSPPRFAIQVNDRRLISRDWAYHLENRLRADYGLEGVPLVIDFVPRKRGTRRAQRRTRAAG